MPYFRAKKTVGAPLDFVAAIETAAILKPMKIITHGSVLLLTKKEAENLTAHWKLKMNF